MSESLVPVKKATVGVHLQFIIYYHSCLCINYSNAEDDAWYQVHFKFYSNPNYSNMGPNNYVHVLI